METATAIQKQIRMRQPHMTGLPLAATAFETVTLIARIAFFILQVKSYVKRIYFVNPEQLKKHYDLKCEYGNWYLGCCRYYVTA